MNLKQFNKNYQYNSKYNMPKIKKIVRNLMKEDINPHLFDFLFRFNTRNYPQTCHSILDLPGEFEKIEDTAVFVIDNGVLQMDYAESIAPDGKMVKRNALNDVEHQSCKLSDEKVIQIFNYCLYMTIQHKKPCYPIVVTNHDYGKEYEDFDIEGFSFRIFFRIFDKEKIYEILNTLTKKDYTKEELSSADYINLLFCIIFAKKPYAKDIIEKIAYLFATIERITFNHQLDLHLALKMTIKYHFRDDEKKVEELLCMITKAINQSWVDELEGYEVKQFTIEELKSKLSDLEVRNSDLEAKYSESESRNSELQAENERQRKRIEELENISRS